MNERARKAKAKQTQPAPSPETHIDPDPSTAELPVRPGQPEPDTGSIGPGADAVQGLLPAAPESRVSEVVEVRSPAGDQPPGSEPISQQDAVRQLREQLGIPAIERTLTNLIQELQARNGVVSNGGAQPRGWLGVIENGLGAVANAIAKYQPGDSGNAQVMSRLIDMALGGIQQNNQIAEVVKLGMAKQLGVDLGAATAKVAPHMTVVPHG